MQSKLTVVKSYKKIEKICVHLIMIHMDKKLSKSYINPVNFAIFQFCSQLELAGSCNLSSPKLELETV